MISRRSINKLETKYKNKCKEYDELVKSHKHERNDLFEILESK